MRRERLELERREPSREPPKADGVRRMRDSARRDDDVTSSAGAGSGDAKSGDVAVQLTSAPSPCATGSSERGGPGRWLPPEARAFERRRSA